MLKLLESDCSTADLKLIGLDENEMSQPHDLPHSGMLLASVCGTLVNIAALNESITPSEFIII